MKLYYVSVNGQLNSAKASKLSVAVKRVLDRYKESQIVSSHPDEEIAHIKVSRGRKI